MRPPLRPPADSETPDEPVAADQAADAAPEQDAKPPADLIDIIDPIPPVDPVDNPFGLSPRELLFVEAYVGVANFRAATAYQMAGYKTTGAASRANASRMLTRERVAAAIAAKCGARIRALRIMDGDEALERLTIHARFDIRKLFPNDKRIAELPDDVALAIKSIAPTKYGSKIEVYDAQHAAEKLAQAGGKLKETVKHEHTLEDIMAAANRPDDGEASA